MKVAYPPRVMAPPPPPGYPTNDAQDDVKLQKVETRSREGDGFWKGW